MNRSKTESNFNSQGRYLASAELEDLSGVPAVPVSFRAAALLSAAKQDFIWWLQGLSLTEGGFRRVARELLEMFPERIGTEVMHKAKVQPEKMYPWDILSSVELTLDARHHLLRNEGGDTCKGAVLIELCRSAALGIGRFTRLPAVNDSYPPTIVEFLVELCLNPKVTFVLPGGNPVAEELETELALESDPKVSRYDFEPAKLVYFHDIIGALVAYRARQEKAVRENFHLTEIGRMIWQTLDYGLRTRGMVLVYGREGRGKTEAVKAWSQLHGGQTRFASLKGITTKTALFRELSRALGITQSYNRAGWEMQARIEDVLKRSKIMLVIDEAHFLFNQSQRTKSRPELVDWINTAVSNCQIPLALCTTPQFMDCMARAAYQVEWNYNQFRRRIKRWIPLPEENTEADISAVAAKVFAGANAAVIKKVISYVFSSGRDLSALGDVATELRELLGTSDFSKATFNQVDQIIRENLYPSDHAFLTQMEIARQRLPKGRKQPASALPIQADPGEFESGEELTQSVGRARIRVATTPEAHHRPGLAHAEIRPGRPGQGRSEAVLMGH